MVRSQLFVFIKKKGPRKIQGSAKKSAFHQILSFQIGVSTGIHNELNKRSSEFSKLFWLKLSKIIQSEANIYMDAFSLKIRSQEI